MAVLETEVLRVDPIKVGNTDSSDFRHLQRAAQELRTIDVPVAFPTETVYGLGADATRSAAVQGIYRAKQRPSDNPLIVHVHSLEQLRELLQPSVNHRVDEHSNKQNGSGQANGSAPIHGDPIPSIYHALIDKYWPGPLTLIMPNPPGSKLAPEVTAGLSTFGVRMPSNPLALALIRAAGKPLAAPSANSSSRPSPTAAEHVKFDLDGRISTILDGGPCSIGVESTVVNGLCNPPLVLRPGGIGIADLCSCKGWENVQIGYQDVHETGSKPLAPGMKYRHYSPTATVILFESPMPQPCLSDMAAHGPVIGLIRTRQWTSLGKLLKLNAEPMESLTVPSENSLETFDSSHDGQVQASIARPVLHKVPLASSAGQLDIWDVWLGPSADAIAQGLFSALRELDQIGVGTIFVEGIDDNTGDVAAAVMNRLRKASEIKIR